MIPGDIALHAIQSWVESNQKFPDLWVPIAWLDVPTHPSLYASQVCPITGWFLSASSLVLCDP